MKLKDDDFVIVVSGAWRRHKRLNEILELFTKLKLRIKNLKIIILGNYRTEKIEEDVIVAGNIAPNNLPDWYRTGNIYVHLSWVDQNPNTLVEAIACGLPALCTNNGGTRELVEKTNSGIVSVVDEDYNYELVDYYNPPKPNFEILLRDFMKIYNNYEFYKKNINTEPIDISHAAKKYLNFFKNNI